MQVGYFLYAQFFNLSPSNGSCFLFLWSLCAGQQGPSRQCFRHLSHNNLTPAQYHSDICYHLRSCQEMCTLSMTYALCDSPLALAQVKKCAWHCAALTHLFLRAEQLLLTLNTQARAQGIPGMSCRLKR